MKEFLCIHKPRKCPICGGKVATVLYGEPIGSKKLYDDLEAKRVVLGGCIVTGHDPTWQCTKCEQEFYKTPAGVILDKNYRIMAIYDSLMEKYKGTNYGSILALLPYAVLYDTKKLVFFIKYSCKHKHRLKICYPSTEPEPDQSKIMYIGDVPDGYMYIKK